MSSQDNQSPCEKCERWHSKDVGCSHICHAGFTGTQSTQQDTHDIGSASTPDGEPLRNVSCAFCRPELIKNQLDRGRDWIAFEPLNPVTKGHLLVIPRRHVVNFTEDPYLTGRIFQVAAQLASDLGGEFNLITSKGGNATQTVFHFHIHLVPRRKNDGLMLPWTKAHEALSHPTSSGNDKTPAAQSEPVESLDRFTADNLIVWLSGQGFKGAITRPLARELHRWHSDCLAQDIEEREQKARIDELEKITKWRGVIFDSDIRIYALDRLKELREEG